MYDYLYLVTYSHDTKERLLDNPLLNFTTKVNTDTGAIDTIGAQGLIKRTANSNGLVFNVYSNGRVEIKGSLHKFYNSITKGIEANYDLFSFADAVNAIKLLEDHYGIIPNETTVHNLEAGVNFEFTTMFVNDLLEYFIAFKNKSFKPMEIKPNKKGNGLDVYFTQYGIKVYNKGLQYNLEREILRFEKKFIKMQSFENGLKLSDLIKPHVWVSVSEKLKEALQGVIFIDSFNDKDLTKAEHKLLLECSNPKFWDNVNYRKRHKYKCRLDDLINTKGRLKLGDNFTNELNRIIEEMRLKKGEDFTKILEKLSIAQNVQRGGFYPLSSRSIYPLSSFDSFKIKYAFYFEQNTKRFCKHTGLPLVYFDKRTQNLNPKTLRYLYSHCKELYEVIKIDFMQMFTGYTKKEPDDFTYIAKQIRNGISNLKEYRDNVNRHYPNEQLTIFNL